MKKIVAVIAAACLLSGCAEIAVPKPDSAKYDLPDDLGPGDSVVQIADYASNYARFAKDVARELKYHDVIFDGSILVAAMAAAGALYFANADVAPRALAGAGLFAGGITAWRSRLSAKEAAGLYERTSRRMTCIARTLRPLASTISRGIKVGEDKDHKAVMQSFATVLALDLAELEGQQQKAEAVISKATDADVKKRGNDALAAAKAEILVANRLLRAIQNGGRDGLDEITHAEADLSSGLNTKSLDYASLETSLINSIKAKAQSQADTSAAGNAPSQQGAGGMKPMAKPTPDDIAKAATNALLVEIAKTKSLTDSAAPAQDVTADLVTCRTTT